MCDERQTSKYRPHSDSARPHTSHEYAYVRPDDVFFPPDPPGNLPSYRSPPSLPESAGFPKDAPDWKS